jgi:protein TonB
MYGQWNLSAARQLKRAYVMVNFLEAIVIAALMTALQFGRRAPPVVMPDLNVPVIEEHYIDIGPAPTILPQSFDRPAVQPQPTIVTSGVAVPVPDTEAANSTLGTQNQLAVVNPLDPRLKGEPGVTVRILPDTLPKPSADTGPAVIPEPGRFVKTSRKPQAAKLQTPDYPNNCRILGIEGTAQVNLLLNLDGSVMEARIARSSGNVELDTAAVRAGRQCRFVPALDNNRQPVRVWVAVPFIFKLDGR